MSFNTGSFNHMAFNRATLAELLAQAFWSGDGAMVTGATEIINFRVIADGGGSAVIGASKITRTTIPTMTGNGTGIFSVGKSLGISFDWAGRGTIVINNDSYNIEVMEYDGILPVGGKLTLNTDKFTLKLNGADVLASFVGTFVDLKVGVNEIQIESDTVTRTLIVRVEHQDRWV